MRSSPTRVRWTRPPLMCQLQKRSFRMARYFRCRNNKVWAAALVVGALAAQVRDRTMQPSFYHSSPEDVRAPRQAPIPIRDAAAKPGTDAHANTRDSTLRRYGNTEQNSRLS